MKVKGRAQVDVDNNSYYGTDTHRIVCKRRRDASAITHSVSIPKGERH